MHHCRNPEAGPRALLALQNCPCAYAVHGMRRFGSPCRPTAVGVLVRDAERNRFPSHPEPAGSRIGNRVLSPRGSVKPSFRAVLARGIERHAWFAPWSRFDLSRPAVSACGVSRVWGQAAARLILARCDLEGPLRQISRQAVDAAKSVEGNPQGGSTAVPDPGCDFGVINVRSAWASSRM